MEEYTNDLRLEEVLAGFEPVITESRAPRTPLYADIRRAIGIILNSAMVNMQDENFSTTPHRVARAFVDTWLSGYDKNLDDVIKTFPNKHNERAMVVVKDIPFYSLCAHHMTPFKGKGAIAYLPKDKVLGLSKFARVIDVFARRLQLQEHITEQVADALFERLQPEGIMVMLYDVEHMCMTSRGAQAHGATTSTSAVRGVFTQTMDGGARQEALSLIFGK